jgi:hypothetical protein
MTNNKKKLFIPVKYMNLESPILKRDNSKFSSLIFIIKHKTKIAKIT